MTVSMNKPCPAELNQLPLVFSHTEHTLSQYFEECLGRQVSILLTDNGTTMLSARVRDDVLRIRLHRMFVNADNGIIEDIVSFLKNRKSVMTRFRKFVRENRERLRTKPAKKVSLVTRGKCHDLSELYHEINEEYFGGMISAEITWGSTSPRHAVRRRTLGSYSERAQLIRINPVLDKKTVPRYFVAFIVYHEMLHAAMGTPRRGARRSIHPKEFRQREKLFKEYEKVAAWEHGRV